MQIAKPVPDIISKLKSHCNIEFEDLKEFLDQRADQYRRLEFVENDPICIPHRYTRKEDIEISGFLTSILSWGQRKTIISKAQTLMHLMDDAPFDFISGHRPSDIKRIATFVHRTFNGDDALVFIQSLKKIYDMFGGMEIVFTNGFIGEPDPAKAIHQFRKIFFEGNGTNAGKKHISDPFKNSAAKRMCMFLRWMVRTDSRGIDFGIWKSIHSSQLACPLDVHSGRVARRLGLLLRKQDDWKAVSELTACLKKFDSRDPVKYDYALFGLGINEHFN